MESRKYHRRLSKEEGFVLMADYYHSGMSNIEYYKTHDISAWHFYKWKRLYLLDHPELKNNSKKRVEVKPENPSRVDPICQSNLTPSIKI